MDVEVVNNCIIQIEGAIRQLRFQLGSFGNSDQKTDVCPTCKGDGIHPQYKHGSVDDCPDCNGTGKRPTAA